MRGPGRNRPREGRLRCRRRMLALPSSVAGGHGGRAGWLPSGRCPPEIFPSQQRMSIGLRKPDVRPKVLLQHSYFRSLALLSSSSTAEQTPPTATILHHRTSSCPARPSTRPQGSRSPYPNHHKKTKLSHHKTPAKPAGNQQPAANTANQPSPRETGQKKARESASTHLVLHGLIAASRRHILRHFGQCLFFLSSAKFVVVGRTAPPPQSHSIARPAAASIGRSVAQSINRFNRKAPRPQVGWGWNWRVVCRGCVGKVSGRSEVGSSSSQLRVVALRCEVWRFGNWRGAIGGWWWIT